MPADHLATPAGVKGSQPRFPAKKAPSQRIATRQGEHYEKAVCCNMHTVGRLYCVRAESPIQFTTGTSAPGSSLRQSDSGRTFQSAANAATRFWFEAAEPRRRRRIFTLAADARHAAVSPVPDGG